MNKKQWDEYKKLPDNDDGIIISDFVKKQITPKKNFLHAISQMSFVIGVALLISVFYGNLEGEMLWYYVGYAASIIILNVFSKVLYENKKEEFKRYKMRDFWIMDTYISKVKKGMIPSIKKLTLTTLDNKKTFNCYIYDNQKTSYNIGERFFATGSLYTDINKSKNIYLINQDTINKLKNVFK